jgi:hypothetical protein
MSHATPEYEAPRIVDREPLVGVLGKEPPDSNAPPQP